MNSNTDSSAVSYEKVKKDALHLPNQDRSHLLESLDDEDDISPEWKDEIRRRVKEMKDGTAIMVPHDEVMANVRASLAKKRGERNQRIMTLIWNQEARD
ncbi:MAG: putative addiction module component [Verrucomicrobiota bacterium]|jgi:putative addiction module component (TIGR02574 family)